MKKLQIGVKGIILSKEKFILIKRSELYGKKLEGMWDLPGGRIDLGEEPEDGLQREVDEELGKVNLDIKRPLHVDSVVNDSIRQIVRITYLCRFVKGSFKLSEEHSEYGWFTANKLPSNTDRLAEEAIKIWALSSVG